MKKTPNAAVANRSETKVAVIGGSGYVGEELVRLLLQHPYADLAAVTSRQFAGKTLADIFPRLSHHQKAGDLRFGASDPAQLAQMAKIIFLALPHGLAAEFAKPLLTPARALSILALIFESRTRRFTRNSTVQTHPAPDLLGQAVYGLPEIYRAGNSTARGLIACPGCYPTSILIPLLPLVRRKAIDRERILVTSLSGVTGAGRKIEADYLFAECNESMRPMACRNIDIFPRSSRSCRSWPEKRS